MALSRTACALFLASLLTFLSNTNSFSVSHRSFPSPFLSLSNPKRVEDQKSAPSSSSLFAEGNSEEKGVSVTNEKREIAFDPESGKIVGEEECEPNDEFCIVDKASGKLVRLTLIEKERIFLDSLQSYYVNGRQLLNDSEFDLLKEDLAWSGSSVANLNRKEATYLNAMQAFSRGDPIISNEEFDILKKELKEDKSRVAVSTEPKCYIDTGICTVTFQEDKFRTNLLYLPAGLTLFILWLGLGFEILEPIIRVNPLVLILIGFPLYYVGAQKITDEFIFSNNKVAFGPCPSCEVESRIYFGNIFGVEGFDDLGDLKCKKCKEKFQVQRDSLRASTLPKKN